MQETTTKYVLITYFADGTFTTEFFTGKACADHWKKVAERNGNICELFVKLED